MKRHRYYLAAAFALWLAKSACLAQPSANHDLKFSRLATSWDEGIPLGNGMLGALIWQKDGSLRFSLDRADLWDLRPMKGLDREEFRYAWVREQVLKKEYGIVQQYFDAPYEAEPAPSKIPGAAMEFDAESFGEVEVVQLHTKKALGEVRWKNGAKLETFVHATLPIGWFRLVNTGKESNPRLIAPKYQGAVNSVGGSVAGDDLAKLGYKQGSVRQEDHAIVYDQSGWGGFHYQVSVRWRKLGVNVIEGVWSLSAHYPDRPGAESAETVTRRNLQNGFAASYRSHLAWWNRFFQSSSITIPDTMLEKQWWLEQYKFGAASRRGAPPISLQAVWTADNGRLPPWKGDYHHDLNTQLSYWPSYSGNHLPEAMAYLDHLEANKSNYKRFTRKYFEKDGLAVPGVTTLTGTEMGGWIQYSLSPTVAAWLGQHYYLQWRYGMDRQFLAERAYPWIRETAIFLEALAKKDTSGLLQLPISSSPEINNNDISAWFLQNTNYDLALMKFTFHAALELSAELKLKDDSLRWKKLLSALGDFAISKKDELMFSPDLPYNESHRHFSHLMAIHPLGLIRWEDGDRERSIIRNSIRLLDEIGPKEWCGYSYAWLANLKARAKDGYGAAEALRIFSAAFCSPNSFHLNGDQSGQGYSGFTYRPFTLEGNFAFAAGLQEMLLQSYAGRIEVMPAVPDDWKEASFTTLRAEGAFLVSARKTSGDIREVRISSEKGGKTVLKLPFESYTVVEKKGVSIGQEKDGLLPLDFQVGGYLKIVRKP